MRLIPAPEGAGFCRSFYIKDKGEAIQVHISAEKGRVEKSFETDGKISIGNKDVDR